MEQAVFAGHARLRPFLKWAGGKTQLLAALQAGMPQNYGRYYEPFIGAGALFLAKRPAHAVINDINAQLINVYRQLKISAADVIRVLDSLDSKPCDKTFYLAMRQEYNQKIQKHELDSAGAALMIWLNKHCFNGLYRVNKQGLFNVPYNNKSGGKSAADENLQAIGAYLHGSAVEIKNADFAEACKSAKAGDFVYFDSPYVPASDTAHFTDYTKNGFSLEDHKRLAELFKYLDAAGVKLMLSNNDVPLVRSLYKGYKMQSIGVKRMINRNADKRAGVEVIVTNY